MLKAPAPVARCPQEWVVEVQRVEPVTLPAAVVAVEEEPDQVVAVVAEADEGMCASSSAG